MSERGFGRRDFLRTGTLGALATAAPRPASGQAASVPVPQGVSADSFEFAEATIAALQEKMQSGALTARALTEAYLARIEALDRQGPGAASRLETNPDALAIADALDARAQGQGAARAAARHPGAAQGQHRHGRPMTTTAGSLALEGSIPPRDSFVAERLREAGAVILGKTNLSEWANFRSTRSTQRLERAGRAGEEPVRARPQPLRLQLRLRAARSSANLCARRRRHRDRRLDRLPARTTAASSGSSRRSAWSAAPASSRSRTARTRPARWPAPCATRRSCSARWPGVDPRDARHGGEPRARS